jgi:AmiR/NasT family two-component response regulator
MVWFAVFAGVAVVWVLVLALLARRLWRKASALAGELATAQSKLDAAQRVPSAGRHAGPRA